MQMGVIFGWPCLLVYMMILSCRPCPDFVKPMENFDFESYYGMWHKMYAPRSELLSEGECDSMKFVDHGTFVSVMQATWKGEKPNQSMKV